MASHMSSLMDLVAQNQPKFQTHQALLVIGLQNDFVQPDGRLPVSTKNGYLERIQALIPKFRELNGNVIWVQTLYEQDRIASDANTGEGDALVVGGLIDGDESGTEAGEEEPAKDLPAEKSKSAKRGQRALDLLKRVSARRKTIPREVAQATAEQDDELFLLRTEKKTPACVPNTHGAEFADVIARLFELPKDMVIRTTNYSAFQGTSLLMTLRAKLVTEVYICGCITNVSVLATVIDAARHGVKINVIEDCLGYRKQTRHDLALKRMDEFFDAYLVNSNDILTRERPETTDNKPSSPNGSRKGSKGSDKPLEALVGRLSLNDADARPSSRPQSIRSPTKVLTGGPRKLSLVSAAESRKAVNVSPPIEPSPEPSPEPTDEQFTDKLVRGAPPKKAEPAAQDEPKEEPKLVSRKIRMRSKGKKKKRKDEEDSSKDNASVSGEPITATSHSGAEPKLVTASATEATKSPSRAAASPRNSVLAKAESVLNLRDRTRQQSLKSVASQPVLSAKAESKDKEKDRESWSERMRMSLSRSSKSEAAAESKKRASVVSTKAPSTISKVDSRPASIVSKQIEPPSTPAKIAPPTRDAPETPSKEPSIIEEQIPPTRPVAPLTKTALTAGEVPERPCQQAVVVPEPTANPESVRPTKAKPAAMGKSKLQSLATFPVMGPGDKIAEGDSRIIHGFFPADFKHITKPTEPLRDIIFDQLSTEVQWQKMLHQQGEVPRLVCCQGSFGEDGSMPVYRHPADQTLPLLHFSPKVEVIRKQAEKLVGHPLNHVLIQLYRSGNDYISEHSDKTLDIVKGSSIVNVSFGAQRTMRLRTKKASKSQEEAGIEKKDEKPQRETQRVAMPHNSMFVLGLESNEKWLHGIMADKRIEAERSEAETAYNGQRISLTFRNIGTFLDAKESTIWGQGATAKEQRDAADVINNDEEESERMIRAFGKENHQADFNWDEHYGDGFDVLHLHKPPEDLPILFAASNALETMQIQLALGEAKIKHMLIDAPSLGDAPDNKARKVTFRDTDSHHTQVSDVKNILMYLDKYYPLDRDERSKPITATSFTIMQIASDILSSLPSPNPPIFAEQQDQQQKQHLNHHLALLSDALTTHSGPFIAGKRFSVADCFVWPILDHLVENSGCELGKGLEEYYRVTWKKKACVKKVREKLGEPKSDGDGKNDEGKKVQEGDGTGCPVSVEKGKSEEKKEEVEEKDKGKGKERAE